MSIVNILKGLTRIRRLDHKATWQAKIKQKACMPPQRSLLPSMRGISASKRCSASARAQSTARHKRLKSITRFLQRYPGTNEEASASPPLQLQPLSPQ